MERKLKMFQKGKVNQIIYRFVIIPKNRCNSKNAIFCGFWNKKHDILKLKDKIIRNFLQNNKNCISKGVKKFFKLKKIEY